ncbi:hypothetical protein OG616_36630 [Streptomyces antibioticus]|uniref:SpvB/TcaC N-terminal domain-containing protein n=1 Tax=Streptomyces antibioticus TaxID=1890 RepID=UPI00225C33DA|nr:SpvB/TcaC N-terminal domain-containing protein [Streptomyces antibioticus]MCX5173532.1 hypothetical protein [Streptomyces antibioticus]
MSVEAEPVSEAEAGSGAMSPLPAPTLPRGGQAVHGLGESVSVDPFTGACQVSIPLALSAGRGASRAELTLTHSGGGARSPYGLGWTLPVPRIARSLRDGVPTYTAGDTFTLDGKDLVPMLVPAPGGGLKPYDEPGVVEGTDVRIRRFRTRTDDGVRVEQIQPTASAQIYWRTWSRDNVVSRYGVGTHSRITDPAGPADPADDTRVSEWLLDDVRDDRGNVTVYEYKPEDTAEVLPSIYEAHRLAPGAPPQAGRYLKRIRYANAVPGDAATTRLLVVLDYGEHDEAVTEVRKWPVRSDPYSDRRAGFEVRVWRLLRRVMVFHEFAELGPGPSPRLVRTIELGHDETPACTMLTSVTQVGHEWSGSAYTSAALPPVTLTYYDGAPESAVRTVAMETAVRDGVDQRWVDLDGDGLPGVLWGGAGGWWYQRPAGEGELLPSRGVAVPQPSRGGAPPSFGDVDGSGRLCAVDESPELAGTARRRDDGSWDAWRSFRHRAVTDVEASEKLDLDGDGFPDLVRFGPDTVTWHRGLGREGYEPARTVRHDGPPVPSADIGHTWFRADMTGDGAPDLVRVRNGSVSYWPALGRGRFGSEVRMAAAPLLGTSGSYDPERVRVVDLDGSGCADLVYLGRDGVVAWPNQAGNRFSTQRRVAPLPTASPGLDAVQVLDLLGKGTACVVRTSSRPGARTRYLDLNAGYGRRGDVRTVANNLGRRVEVEYSSSTAFALAARRAGEPWATRLASPVTVVSRLTEHDDIAGTAAVSSYAYRDGWFHDREFRGFARVEVTESDGALTRTLHWFHIGASEAQPQGIFSRDPAAVPVAASKLEGVQGGRDYAEALRALTGRPLRTETFGEEGKSATPFTVSEERYRVVRVQGSYGDRPPVFRVEPLETVEHHYERDAADPRVHHELTLATDLLGNIVARASVAYPRRVPQHREQSLPLVSYATTEVVNSDTAVGHRVGVVVAQREYDVTGVPVPASGRYDVAVFGAALAALPERAIEQVGLPGAGRRLTGVTLLEYWNDALGAPLPHGQIGRRGLLRRTRRLALTPGLVASVYGTDVGASALAEAGYENVGGAWYADVGVTSYAPGAMYQPVSWTFLGNTATVAYDVHGLLVVETRASTTAPLDLNAVLVRNDYRVLAPGQVTDPHGTVSRVSFDPLGRVTASWLTGADGSGDPADLPGVEHTYASGAWLAGAGPAWSQTDTRVIPADATAGRRQRMYTDGLGRVVMTKTLAEPGLAIALDGTGGAGLVDTSPLPRWVASGRTVFNGRGLPAEQYEPYFSTTAEFEDADALVKHTVTDLRTYDSLGRVVRIDHPDGTLERWTIGPWHEVHHDRNDTVRDSAWFEERQQPGTGAADARAAIVTDGHRDTPLVSLADPLGRLVRTRGDLGTGASGVVETVRHHDLAGLVVRVDDALGRVTATQVHDALGRVVETRSIDAGRQRALLAVDGVPVRQWGADGDVVRCGYDGLRRRIRLFVTDAGAVGERLAEFTVHGEAHPQAATRFLIGRVHRRYDEAGCSRVDAHDLAGNIVEGTRQVLEQAAAPDWSVLDGVAFAGLDAAAAPLLDAQSFVARSTFNAVGQPLRQEMPDGTVLESRYDAGGLLTGVRASPAGGTAFDVLTAVEHDARQRRTLVALGNGVTTRYGYDDRSKRLRDMVTTGPAGTTQDLRYTYDPVGNVLQIDDHATPTVFYAGAVTDGTRTFAYDALYRLVSATGREHASLGAQHDHSDPQIRPVPHPHDSTALRPYSQSFEYDAVGNLGRLAHSAGAGSYTRSYTYDDASNRLLAHSLPGDPPSGPFSAAFSHDGAGRMIRMPHLARLTWDHSGSLRHVDRGGGGSVTYHTDSTGHRVRKVWQRNGGVREERVHVGDFEVFRRFVNGVLVFERTTVHVRETGQRIAMIEQVTVDTATPGSAPAPPVVRYQHGDHLGSTVVETDFAGAVLSCEEFHPYGTTAVWLARSAAKVSTKRYRYIGKERDEETSLYSFGARSYAPWLARWIGPDPAGLADGANRYAYVSGNPVRLLDPDGLAGEEMEQMWFSESKLLGLQRKATASGRGFTRAVRKYFADTRKVWGGPDTYHLGHEADKPFALLKPGEQSTIVAQSAKSNLKQAAQDKAKVAQEVAKGALKRDPKTGLYPGATKGVKVQQPPIPKVVGHKGLPVTAPKPPASVVAPKAPVPKGVPVKPPEQLTFDFGAPAPKTPSAVPPVKPVVPATPAAPTAVAPATVAAPQVTSVKAPAPTTPTAVPPTVPPSPVTATSVAPPKITPTVNKLASGADDAAAAAKAEAATAKAMQTGGAAVKSVVPVVKAGTPAVKASGALTKAVATGTRVLKAAQPVVKVAAPVVKAAAPVVKLVGKVAKPLAVGVAACEMATANNNSERLVAAGDLAAGAAAYGGPVGVAFSVGYTVGGLADKGITAASRATIGVDLSPSNLLSHGMTGADRVISGVLPDSPSKPAYKNENKIAWFMIDTLGF